jgi:hypothetical protein
MTLRLLFAAVWLASSALAGPPLTTIQDVLYKADGTRFNGTVTISWTSFQAMDNSTIATQSVTVKIVDGNLRVQLVPTTTSTPTTYYSAKYNSNGRIQFEETWSVPSSAQPLHVRDVRIAMPSNVAAAADTSGTSTPAQESDIVGLIADLGARPLKGAGFAAGRTAVVDALGALESASGSATDCVHVDGSSGPCGGCGTVLCGRRLPGRHRGRLEHLVHSLGRPQPRLQPRGLPQRHAPEDRPGLHPYGGTIQFVAAARAAAGRYPAGRLPHDGVGFEHAANVPQPPGVVQRDGRGHQQRQPHQHRNLRHSSRDFWPPATEWRSASISRTRARLRVSASKSIGARPPSCIATPPPGRRSSGGRADAALLAAGAQLNSQSWGALLPFSTTVGSATDSYASGLTIDFQGMLAQTGDTLTLGNYTVVRFP